MLVPALEARPWIPLNETRSMGRADPNRKNVRCARIKLEAGEPAGCHRVKPGGFSDALIAGFDVPDFALFAFFAVKLPAVEFPIPHLNREMRTLRPIVSRRQEALKSPLDRE